MISVGVIFLAVSLLSGESLATMFYIWFAYTTFLVLFFYFWARHIKGKLKALTKEPLKTDEKEFIVKFAEGKQVEQLITKVHRKMEVSQLVIANQKARHAGENLDLILSNTVDPLTGVANRREMEAYLKRLISRKEVVSVILMDIDHFKKVNDTYGHDIGDIVLKQFCSIVRHAVRPQDYLCRYGGEEFLAICQADIEEALSIAERVRAEVSSTPISISENQSITITASFGVAQHNKGENHLELIKRADLGLYAAKEKGRNKVERGVDNKICAG